MELQRPYARHDRARNRALAALARRLGVQVRGHRRRPRARARQGRAAGRVRGAAPPRHARRLRAAAARQPQPRDEHAAGDGQPLRRPSRGGPRDAGAGRAADVRPDARTSATAIRAPRTRAPRGAWPSCAGRGWTSATGDAATGRGTGASSAEARARLEQELRVIEQLGLAGFFLLHHDMLELAREVALEVRGPDSVRALLAPGRGRGSSVSSLVCYLTGLSHIDPIANRLALGRFLHEDLQRAARHRPRLPARHPRAADPARARALRARPRGAGGGLSDLPRARGDPRAGQGPRPARRRDRARGARGGAVGRSIWQPAHQPGASAPLGIGARRAGAGWRAWSSRPTGCPATSPSTRAG